MRLSVYRLIALAALLVPGTQDLAAQGVVRLRAAGQQSGWLGFAYEPVTVGARDARRPAIVIREVVEDSPAERAGLQVGDTVLTINDIRVTEQFMNSLVVSLAPGDNVRLRLRRAGREREISVQAVERPVEYAIERMPDTWAFEISPDSVRGRVRLYLDSALVALDSLRMPRVRVERSPGGGVWMFRDSTRIELMPDSAWPRMRGEARLFWADSLRIHADSMMRHLEPELRAYSFRMDSLLRADSSLFRVMPRGAFEFRADSTLRRYLVEPRGLPRGQIFGFSGDSLFTFEGNEGAFGIAVLGLRALGGAELAELNPELGEYFGTERGVLVVRVPDETPAARAGLEAGDVIVRVNGTDVSTVSELRRAVNRAGDAIRLEVVRKKARRTIELRND